MGWIAIRYEQARRTLWWALRLFAVVLAVLVALIAGTIAFVNRIALDSMRGSIEEAATAVVGRPVTIDGAITLLPSLKPALEVEGIRLADLPHWPALQIGRIERARLQLGLVPLLRGGLHIHEISAQGVKLSLTRRTNRETKRRTITTARRPADTKPAAGTRLFTLIGLDELMLREVTINYVDKRLGARYTIQMAELRGTAGPGDPIELILAGAFEDTPIKAGLRSGSLAEFLDAKERVPLSVNGETSALRFELATSVVPPLTTDKIRLEETRVHYQEPRFQVKAEINSLRLDHRHKLAIDQLMLSDVKARLTIDREQRWHLDSVLDKVLHHTPPKASGAAAGRPSSRPERQEAGQQESTRWEYGIAQLRVKGNSELQILDEGVTPAYRTVFRIKRCELSNVSNTPITSTPTTLACAAEVNRHAAVSLSGTVKSRPPQRALELAGEIEAFGLPPLSSYTTAHGGFNIDSGQMDAHLKLQIVKNHIDGIADIVVHGLDVSPSDMQRLGRLEDELGISLKKAVRLLREDDGSIRLSMPFSGEMDAGGVAINVDLSGAINRALQALAFYGLLLHNPAAVLMASAIFGKGTKFSHVDSVLFTPGTANLTPGASEFLAEVAAAMRQHPETRIKVCGRTVGADRKALGAAKSQPVAQDDLLALADERAATVKEHLVKQYGIEAGRLIACRPRFDPAEKSGKPQRGAPRIELWH